MDFKLYAFNTGSKGMHLEYYRNAVKVFRSKIESRRDIQPVLGFSSSVTILLAG